MISEWRTDLERVGVGIRLLLRDAVNGSHAPDEWLAIDADNPSIRKHSL